MANSHNLFQVYNSAIKLPDSERELLKQARNSLRNRMQMVYQRFSEIEKKTHSIDFQTQGSFVMDTIIKPHTSEEFDLDDGVYFQGNLTEEQRVDTKIFHDLIIKAIDRNNEIEEIIDKDTCVRVKYLKNYGNINLNFHIDIPIYYAEKMETPELAHKKEGWVESSPVEFIAWFEEKAKSGFDKAFLFESLKYADFIREMVVRYQKTGLSVKANCKIFEGLGGFEKRRYALWYHYVNFSSRKFCT